MKLKYILLVLFLFLMPSIETASSEYGNIDVYYNDELLPGKEVAKPILQIGEPFRIRVDFTFTKDVMYLP